jgi:hypothetical protein
MFGTDALGQIDRDHASDRLPQASDEPAFRTRNRLLWRVRHQFRSPGVRQQRFN